MRRLEMQPIRKIGLETGTLTDEEIKFIDTVAVQTVYPLLVGRQLFPITRLPDAGYLSSIFYTETDMGQATISMTGEMQSRDALPLTASTAVPIPVISKDFKLHWRDVIAARRRGEPLDLAHIRNASRQVAEEEDKLLLSGEYTGWPALGIKGLLSATGRNTTDSDAAWPAQSLDDIGDATTLLNEDGFYGPFVFLVTPTMYVKLLVKYSSERSYRNYILEDMLPPGSLILQSAQLYAAAGGTGSAALVQPGADNFDMLVGQDVTTYMVQDEDMNTLGKVYEVLTPRIKRPTSICEITTIAYA